MIYQLIETNKRGFEFLIDSNEDYQYLESIKSSLEEKSKSKFKITHHENT